MSSLFNSFRKKCVSMLPTIDNIGPLSFISQRIWLSHIHLGKNTNPLLGVTTLMGTILFPRKDNFCLHLSESWYNSSRLQNFSYFLSLKRQKETDVSDSRPFIIQNQMYSLYIAKTIFTCDEYAYSIPHLHATLVP